MRLTVIWLHNWTVYKIYWILIIIDKIFWPGKYARRLFRFHTISRENEWALMGSFNNKMKNKLLLSSQWIYAYEHHPFIEFSSLGLFRQQRWFIPEQMEMNNNNNEKTNRQPILCAVKLINRIAKCIEHIECDDFFLAQYLQTYFIYNGRCGENKWRRRKWLYKPQMVRIFFKMTQRSRK